MQLPNFLAPLMMSPSPKERAFKLALLKVVLKGGGICFALLVVAIILGVWAGGREETRNEVRSEVDKLTAESVALQNKLTRAEKALPVYQTLLGTYKGIDIPLDRQQAKETIEAMRDEHFLGSLRISISPLQDMPETKYKNNYVTGVKCTIMLGIEALSDEDVMAFLKAVTEKLPGSIKVTTMTLTRQALPTPDVVNIVAERGHPTFVRADVKLDWRGMKSVPKPAAAAPVPPPGAKP